MIGTRKARFLYLVILVAALAPGNAPRAEGPLVVGGPPSPPAGFLQNSVPGQPFRWTINPVTYWTDPGPSTGPALGNQTAAQADALTQQAFQVWQDVPTSNITFSAAGHLGADVTSANIMAVLNAIEDCTTLPGPPAGGIAQQRSVIYDVDGSAVKALGEDPTTTLGFADVVCAASDGTTNFYQRGEAVMNGLFIDGIKTATNPEVTLDEFTGAFIHEFGHMIGLDHSQVNLQCLTGFSPCTSDDLAGVPIMFPVALPGRGNTLSVDDIAGVSVLYPETVTNPPTQVPFASTTGRLQGRVFFTDGATQAQGYNVIARQVTNPGRIAVSSVSGFLYTADAGNAAVPSSLTEDPFGSRNTTLIGFFDIPGLPPGSYTIEVEAINNSGKFPFVGGSSLGPIGNLGFQFPLSGSCTNKQFFNIPSPGLDPCNIGSQITVNAGDNKTGNDIIFVGTAPQFDAWED